MALMFRLVALALVASGTVAHAADSKVAGKWTFEGDVQGYPIHDVCALSGTDEKLTGTCTNGTKDRDTIGSFDGTTLTLKHAGEYEGQALTITYTGKLQKDGTVTGEINVQPLNYQGSFTATAAAAGAAKP